LALTLALIEMAFAVSRYKDLIFSIQPFVLTANALTSNPHKFVKVALCEAFTNFSRVVASVNYSLPSG